MAKVAATQSAYQIFEDIIVLAGGIAKLGKTIAAQKIQSSADAASHLVHTKVDMADINAQLSEAKESLSQASDYAMHTDVKQMVDDASVFARKHPVATLVSVIALGSLIANMMRSGTTSPPATAKRGKSTVRKAQARSPKAMAKVRAKASAGPKSNGAARTHA